MEQAHSWARVLRLFHQDKGWGFVTSEEITGLFFGKACWKLAGSTMFNLVELVVGVVIPRT